MGLGLMSKANIITIIRIVLVPLFVVILLTEMNHKEWIAFAIYVIAAVTDSLDGYIARRFKEVTVWASSSIPWPTSCWSRRR